MTSMAGGGKQDLPGTGGPNDEAQRCGQFHVTRAHGADQVKDQEKSAKDKRPAQPQKQTTPAVESGLHRKAGNHGRIREPVWYTPVTDVSDGGSHRHRRCQNRNELGQVHDGKKLNRKMPPAVGMCLSLDSRSAETAIL